MVELLYRHQQYISSHEKQITCPAGSLIILDSNLWHRGECTISDSENPRTAGGATCTSGTTSGVHMRRLPAALLLLSSTSSNLVTYTDAFHFNRGGRRALLLSAAPSRSPHDGSCAVDEDLKPDESCVEALVDSLTVEEYAFDAGENGEESFDADISAALATLQALSPPPVHDELRLLRGVPGVEPPPQVD